MSDQPETTTDEVAEDELTTEELAKVSGGGRSEPPSGTGPHTSADVTSTPADPNHPGGNPGSRA